MGYNPVLDSTKFLVENPKYVFINQDKLNALAERFSKEDLKLPYWNEEVFPEKNDESTIDFFMLVNSINFAFMDFTTKTRFSTTYNGRKYVGSFGMSSCLKRALNSEVPVLEGEYLKELSEDKAREIFSGNIEIPMLRERVGILNQIGEALCDKYEGYFHNFVSSGALFKNREGLIEKLIHDFPSFDDSYIFNRKKVIFNKRAQLLFAQLYGRFRDKFVFEDIADLTVFADYILPGSLRNEGVLEFKKSLAERVDNQQLIESGSIEELEIRASTVHSADMLTKRINKLRKGGNRVFNIHVDARLFNLWLELRRRLRSERKPHHLTKTIAY